MTRDQLIESVQTKLDEKSPFDEPQTFIAAAGDSSYDKVKPIKMYIEDLLDEAANDCLRVLPLTLVGADVKKQSYPAAPITNGVGTIVLQDNAGSNITYYLRLVRVKATNWKKEVTSFITSSDPLYLLQQDENTRGKLCKPVVAWVPEYSCLELYSFPGISSSTVNAEVYYIPCNKTAGSNTTDAVLSSIDEFVVIRCAELVCNVFGSQTAQVFQKEFAEKVNSVLK